MLKVVLSRFHRWLGKRLAESSAELPTPDNSPAKVRFRKKVLQLQTILPNGPELYQLEHYFAPAHGGYLYAREVHVPKGHVVVSKLHKHPHLVFITQGKILVATESGKFVYEAPCTFVAEAGVKRAAIALEDTTWTTAHVVRSTGLDEIEAELIAESYDELGLESQPRMELE